MAVKQILAQSAEFAGVKTPCVTVENFDDDLRALVADMWDSMYCARGVGLAAPQIGARLRVAVIDTILRPNSNRRLVLVNPKIESFEGEQTGEEGCLSMPGENWPITRAALVVVRFKDLTGQEQTLCAKGLTARAVQHECDHLNGIFCNSRAVVKQASEESKGKTRVLVTA